MAHPYRLQAESCLYRVPSRGDDRKNIFLSKTGYQNSLHTLKQQKKNNLVSVIAMVLAIGAHSRDEVGAGAR